MKLKSTLTVLCILGLLAGMILSPDNSQAAVTAGSISGTVSYTGEQDTNHEVIIGAHLDYQQGPELSVQIWGLGAYTLTDLPDGDYYISAFLNIHDRDDGPPEFGEPNGWYDSNGDGNPDQVTVSGGSLTGIDIELQDVTDEYIQGTTCYLGGVYGPGGYGEVALHTQLNEEPVVAQRVSLPCDDYIFNGGPAGTYYVSFVYDVNGSSGPPDPGEPVAWYDSNGDGTPDPLIYTGAVITDVNIIIGQIHYVDFSASGENDGSSWQDAYTDLQDALAAAEPGEEIWVAAGIYTPGTSREASFVLRHGVAVYGGFNGTEQYRYQRNWRANQTVLSGEIGNPAVKTDNVYHVVTTASTLEDPLDASAILDGFTISGGYASQDINPHDKGGGLLNSLGAPTLVNLNFTGNFAFNHGGALATQGNLEPLQVINCTFSGNSTNSNGGGIGNLSQIALFNSSLTGNNGGNGGGLVGLPGSSAEIHNTILWGNQGVEIGLQGDATANVSYSVIEGGYAGGINIVTQNPLFVDADGADNQFGTWDDDLHLSAGSSAIDAGDNTRLPADLADSDGDSDFSEALTWDIDQDSRRVNDPVTGDTGNGTAPLVDIGADEYAPAQVINGLSIATSPAAVAGQELTLAARVAGGSQINYQWDFGDGNTANGAVVRHIYATPGVYQVEVTASNSLGSQLAQNTLHVSEVFLTPPGGSSSTADGVLTIAIPDTITGTVSFIYTPLTNPTGALGNYDYAGLAFTLESELVADPAMLTAAAAYTLTLQYDDAALPANIDEADLELRRFDVGSSQWLALVLVSHDLENDTLTVLVEQFSEFALLAEKTDFPVFLPLLQR